MKRVTRTQRLWVGGLSPVLALVLASCAPDDNDVSSFTFATPRALIDCATPPADLSARMWISGSATPCELDVDVDGNTTTGACTTRPGLVRTLTVDWFVPVDEGGLTELVVAQARGALDLTKGDAAEATFTVAEEDVVTSECLDMRDDQVDGSLIVEVNGAGVPVCDVDDSCAGDADNEVCTNLGELCAGADPFDAGEEP